MRQAVVADRDCPHYAIPVVAGIRRWGFSLSHPDRRHQLTAFSLIELLVVVAIIALLISILLPSLSQVRAQARSAACASQLGQLGHAESLYQTANREWIPGSPWTTGHTLMLQPTTFAPGSPGFPRLLDWFDWSIPLTIEMQGAGSFRNAPPNRLHWNLLMQYTSGIFRCPSNPHVARPYPLSLSQNVAPYWIPAVSYMSMLSVMRAGPGGYDEVRYHPALYRAFSPSADPKPGHVANARDWGITPPEGYRPRHSHLGRESMKVFLADGFRFYDRQLKIFDYDPSLRARAAKGVSNIEVPPSEAGTAYNEMYNAAAEYAYRHGNNDRINAVFFDGHVDSLAVNYRDANTERTNFTGPAIHPKWYWPSGTTIENPALNHLKLPANFVLP